jgi:predicted nucleic acid-binding protein
MKVTREVIIDLLPLYVAEEVSEDSRKLVEAFLDQDEDMKRLAERVERTGLKEIPMTEQKEISLEAYEKANRWMVIRTLGLAVIISATLMGLLAMGVLIANFDVLF